MGDAIPHFTTALPRSARMWPQFQFSVLFRHGLDVYDARLAISMSIFNMEWHLANIEVIFLENGHLFFVVGMNGIFGSPNQRLISSKSLKWLSVLYILSIYLSFMAVVRLLRTFESSWRPFWPWGPFSVLYGERYATLKFFWYVYVIIPLFLVCNPFR